MTRFWFTQEIIQRFAGSLLHFLWQGALVALLTAFCLKLLRKSSAEARYAVSIAALIVMLAAPVFTFLFYEQTGAVALKLVRFAGQMLNSSGQIHPVASVTAAWTQWIVIAWCTGVFTFTLRLALSWHLSRRLIESSNAVVPASVLRIFTRIKERIAGGKAVRLFVNISIDTPIVVGCFRPVVLLPISAITGLTEEQLLAVLAHELAHIRRHDFPLNILQRCVESVLFYHPAVWWLSSRIRAERENCCDDTAVRICGSRRVYVEALLELELKRPVVPTVAIAASGGSLVQRVQRILGMETSNGDWQTAAAILLIMASWMVAGMWQSSTVQAVSLRPSRAEISSLPLGLSAGPSPIANAIGAIAAIVTAQPATAEAATGVGIASSVQIERGTIHGVVRRAGSSDSLSDVQVTIAGDGDDPRAFGALWTSLAPLGFQSNPIYPDNQPSEERLVQSLSNVMQARGIPLLDLDFLTALKRFRASTAQFQATSDIAGRFTLEGVPPGQYIVRGEREAFFGTSGRGANTSLASTIATVLPNGTADIVLSLLPGATMGGTIRDSYDRPLAYALVQALGVTYQNGYPVLQSVMTDTTDDRGQFRLFWLPPGEYFVVVNSWNPEFESPIPINSRQSMPGKTYFPGTPDVTRAIPFVLKAGDNKEGINFLTQKASPVRISGIVNDAVPHSGFEATMMLMQRDDTVPDDTGDRVVGLASLNSFRGSFDIAGVRPGFYDLYARVPDSNPNGVGTTAMTFGHVAVDARNGDVSGLAIDIHPSVAVSGTVLVKGNPRPGMKLQLGIQVEGSAAKIPYFQAVAGRRASAEANGSFTFPAVPDGHYRLTVEGLPAGLYVADVRQNGLSVFDSGFDVGVESPPPIEVIVNEGAAIVQGLVRNDEKMPLSGASVVLVPTQEFRKNRMLYRIAITDSSGHFVMNNAAPGDYKVFAWQDVPSGAYYNSRFLAAYEPDGRGIHLSQASAITANVIAIPGR